jgi:NAD+ synthase|tara:strand:+ start:7231 stop:8022 length:792 start_codon:yes stop_codon:yes gene_type:complete
MKSAKKVENHIIQWLKSYLDSSQLKGFVVGISGGVDSAVTSTLCAKTGQPVLCLEMPILQQSSQENRAKDHVQWLKQHFSNVTSIELPLDSVFLSFQDLLPTATNPDAHLLSLANTRARLRMTSLYYFAALHRYVVAGTGNKVEDFGVGFYTKYGDGGVDLSPIADLNKTQVFALAKHLGVIESIQKAAPTDGLWGDHRTDEDQLGASYAELEWAMEAKENQLSEDSFSEREKIVFDRFLSLNRQNKHKMIPIPVCEIPEVYL